MAEIGEVSKSCEIVESDEPDSRLGWPGRGKKDIMSRYGKRYAIEEDINGLLEAVIRASGRGQTSLEALTKKAMKKPVCAGWSPSSTLGISAPASLKQALRGICISQASELAAVRRLSKPQHPSLFGTSEVRIVGSNSAALRPMEPSESSYTVRELQENITELFHAPVVNASTSTVSQSFPLPVTRVLDSAASTSAAASAKISKAKMGEKLRQLVKAEIHAEAGTRKLKKEWSQSGPRRAAGTTYTVVTDDKVSPSVIVPSSAQSVSNYVNESEVHCTPSSAVQCKKNKQPSKSAHFIKTFLWNKNKPKKKVEQGPCSSSNSCSYRPNVEVNFVSGADCVTCETPDYAPSGIKDFNSCQGPTDSNRQAVDSFDKLNPHMNARLKSTESKSKGVWDFSQSTKSSNGDFSCSTSISEESSFSRSSLSGRRPHMSKDLRWEAIHHVQKLYGILSLTHFKLLKKLGCGDIGTVYLAELLSTNSLFAIKVMDNEFLTSINRMSRAKTEREILQMLDHPFLPTLYAYFTTDKFSCLVMEYCRGGDLHVLRQKQPGRCFSEQAARFYGAEILLALEYLHLQGVVYRDLKPENILVREDGHIMVTDFDLSLRCSVHPTLLKSSSAPASTTKKTLTSTRSTCIDPFCTQPMWKVPCFTPNAPSFTRNSKNLKSDPAAQFGSLPLLIVEPTTARSNSFVGTHEYLAPEIINGDGHGSAVDWWTFGIFLYELIYSKTPFKGQTNEDTLANVIFQPLAFPQTPIVSFHAKDLIQRLLTKDPDERLGSLRGAAEIKQHSFFHGLNWALVRCATPPELPSLVNTDSLSDKRNLPREIFEPF